MRTVLAGACALALSLAVAPAPQSPSRHQQQPKRTPSKPRPGAVKLRYRFRSGQTDKYSVDLTLSAQSADQSATVPTMAGAGTQTLRVLQLFPDGSAAVEAQMKDFRMYAQAPITGTSPVIVYHLSPLGKASDYRNSARPLPAGLPFDPSAFVRMGALLPEAAVGPGDSWSGSIANPFTGKEKIALTSRFFQTERWARHRAARIHQSFTVPVAMKLRNPDTKQAVSVSGTLKVNAALHFDVVQGKLLQSAATGQGTFTLALPHTGKGKAPEAAKIQMKVDVTATLIE